MAKSVDRQDRLAAALRANLKRRKIRSRVKADAQARIAAADEGATASSAAEAGSLPHPRRNPARKDG